MPRRLSSLNFSFFGRKGFCTLKSVRLRKNAGPTVVPAADARCVGASCCAGSAAGISTGRASARIAFRPSLARSLRPVRPCSEWRGKRDTISDILYIPCGRGGAAHAHFGAARRGPGRAGPRGGRAAQAAHCRASGAAPLVERAGRADETLLRKELSPR